MADNARFDFKTIQVLRFIAAIMVVLCHATFYAKERLSDTFLFFAEGANGVPLFFVISGFVMVVSSEKLRTLADGWKIFAQKRILRIVPLYWFVLTFKLVVMTVSTGLVLHSQFNLGYIVKSYLFIPAYNVDGIIQPLLGVGWTLNFEMLFYLIFALALWRKVSTLIWPGIVLVTLTLLSFAKTTDWPVSLFFFCDPIVINFFLGIIAGYLVRGRRVLSRPISFLAIFVGLVYLFAPLMLFNVMDSFSYTLLNACASFMIVYGAASLDSRLEMRYPDFVLFFGAASYSLYLVHPVVAPLGPVILAYVGLKLEIVSVLLSVAIALMASGATYVLVEEKMSAFLKRKIFKPDLSS